MPRLQGFGYPVYTLPPPTPQDTLRWMARLAQEAQLDPRIRVLAEQIVGGLFAHDYLSEYVALLNWVRSHVRYLRDSIVVEQVKGPRVTVETGQGDCDDQATLLAALVGAIGGKARFVAGAFRYVNGRPALSHVWTEAWEPASKVWVILDPVPGQRVAQMRGNLQSTITLPAVG